jgi:hypothetical protein
MENEGFDLQNPENLGFGIRLAASSFAWLHCHRCFEAQDNAEPAICRPKMIMTALAKVEMSC